MNTRVWCSLFKYIILLGHQKPSFTPQSWRRHGGDQEIAPLGKVHGIAMATSQRLHQKAAFAPPTCKASLLGYRRRPCDLVPP